MSAKSFFSSSKKKKKKSERPERIPPVGETVPVLGTFVPVIRFVNKASWRPPFREFGLSAVFSGQGRHRSSFFHLLGIEVGARCPVRRLWREKLEGTENFVVILSYADAEEDIDTSFNYFGGKHQLEELLSIFDNKKNILILFETSDEQKLEETGPLNPVYDEWIRKLQEQHQVTHFAVCLNTERGMEAALDWVASHLTSPATEADLKEVSPQEKEEVKTEGRKSNSALRWLAEMGKKVLEFGAASKSTLVANS